MVDFDNDISAHVPHVQATRRSLLFPASAYAIVFVPFFIFYFYSNFVADFGIY